MTSMIAKFVGKKILGETIANNFGKEDPYFETVPATKIDGRSSHKKPKQRRKALPPGLSEKDGKVLTKVKRRAYRLDMSFGSCCGIKFGWGSIIGLVPVIGDVIDALLALMVVQTCRGVEGGLPPAVQMQMMFNIALDFGVGLVPFLGDLADAVYKANTRNAVVLEKYLRQKGAQNLKKQGHQLPIHDPSEPDEYERQEHSPPPQYTASPVQGRNTQDRGGNGQGQLPQTQAPKQSGGGFFSNKQQPQSDPERGYAVEGSRAHRQESSQDTVGRNKSTLQKERR